NTSMQNIKLIDVLGKIVMNKSLNGDKNGFIDTSSLAKGSYFVVIIEKNGNRLIKKVMI
ncbi:MAG TPA: T9SS type A sorting domain-containing protein, partial [Lutibacter sp.]|nr:T9SS type A sorting domain-containing protein [Lutibacter sp.]